MNARLSFGERNARALAGVVLAAERPDLVADSSTPELESLHDFSTKAQLLAQAGAVARELLVEIAADAATAATQIGAEDKPPSPAAMAALSVLGRLVLLVDETDA